jgi:hypothetical protein
MPTNLQNQLRAMEKRVDNFESIVTQVATGYAECAATLEVVMAFVLQGASEEEAQNFGAALAEHRQMIFTWIQKAASGDMEPTDPDVGLTLDDLLRHHPAHRPDDGAAGSPPVVPDDDGSQLG